LVSFRLKVFTTLVLVLLLSGVVAYMQLQDYWYDEPISLPQNFSVEVAEGEAANTILYRLHLQGVPGSPWLSKLALRLFFPEFVLKKGEYEFGELNRRADIFARLHAGVSTQYRVVLVEGKTFRQIAAELIVTERLQQPAGVDPASLDSAIDGLELLNKEALALMGDNPHAEGWFYPDTYYFARGETPRSILLRAHHRMVVVLLEEWEQRAADLPYKNAYDALIMASLIERETGAVDERGDIAGVFVRRLKKGMRLQTDPSVIYGMGDHYSGNLTRKHLRTDTPYNTYTRGGLPPTPIALPGRAAIHAALHPAPGTTLYFVARGDGRHAFSETLEEHQAAVKRYQLMRRSDYRSSPLPPEKSEAGDVKKS